MQTLTLARLHGSFNLVSGLWPLLHMRSFEAVTGKKTDRWLVRTVAGLLCTIGWTQVHTRRDRVGLTQARTIGLGTAGTLAAIDLTYALSGRIRKIYLADAAIEAAWLMLWGRSRARR